MPQFDIATFFIQFVTCCVFLISYYYYFSKNIFIYFLEIRKYRIKKFNFNSIFFVIKLAEIRCLCFNSNFKNLKQY